MNAPTTNPLKYPLDETYPAIYRDAHGTERATIHNDGNWLRLTVRGLTFEGWMLDDFEQVEGTPPDALQTFTLTPTNGQGVGELCHCEIEYEAPMPLVVTGPDGTGDALGVLTVKVALGALTPRGFLDRHEFILGLRYKGETFYSNHNGTRPFSGFEDEMPALQEALPPGVVMRACTNCEWASYGGEGHGTFGCMACFRDSKAAFLPVIQDTKYARLIRHKSIFNSPIWATRADWVQETYHCPEWTPHSLGTGYPV